MPELYAAGILMCADLAPSSSSSWRIFLTWPIRSEMLHCWEKSKWKACRNKLCNELLHLGHRVLSTVVRTDQSGNSREWGAAGRLPGESGAPTRCRVSAAGVLHSLTKRTFKTWFILEYYSERRWIHLHHSPTSRGFVMKIAFGATPNISWWCHASGTSSPSGTASCMFMVATGTAPLRIQRASQVTSLTFRRGWRWKKRPETFPRLASSAPWMSWVWVAPRQRMFQWQHLKIF